MNDMNNLRSLLGERDPTRQRLIKAVMVRPEPTQKALAQRTGLSEGTISGIATALREQYVFEPGQGVRLAPTRGVAVGVELGFQNCAVVARRADQTFDQAEKAWIDVGAEAGEKNWLPRLTKAILDTADAVADGHGDIVTVGVAVPRMVDLNAQQFTSPLLSPWHTGEQPPQVLIQKALAKARDGMPAPSVVLDNDAKRGALAESLYGAGQEQQIVFYVEASTGIGSGIVIDGKIIRGRGGVAGEIGHVKVRPRGAICLCGGRGCLDTVIGADALVEKTRDTLGQHRHNAPNSLEELMDRAVKGDQVCLRVLTDAAATLGGVLGNMCNLLNPDVIIIGGAWSRSPDPEVILRPCREALRDSAMGAIEGLDVVTGRLEKYAVAHGALALGIEGIDGQA
jgi:predicted NBD/HSP70 family sugar kinase